MNETVWLDNYLLGKLSPSESLLAEVKLLLDPELKDQAHWQQHTYELVKQYGRKCLKQEIEAVHKKMFSEKRFEDFRKKIAGIFK